MNLFTWMWAVMKNMVECTALCKSFRCDRKPPAMVPKGKGKNKQIWCNWIDEECDGPWCTYAKCKDRRMTDNGLCKPAPTKQYADEKSSRDLGPEYPDAIPKEYAKRFRIR